MRLQDNAGHPIGLPSKRASLNSTSMDCTVASEAAYQTWYLMPVSLKPANRLPVFLHTAYRYILPFGNAPQRLCTAGVLGLIKHGFTIDQLVSAKIRHLDQRRTIPWLLHNLKTPCPSDPKNFSKKCVRSNDIAKGPGYKNWHLSGCSTEVVDHHSHCPLLEDQLGITFWIPLVFHRT